MSKRINAISKYIDINDKVLDIGCDKALLGIELSKRKIYTLSIDKVKSIIDDNINTINNKYISFRVSDGLINVTSKDKINTYVLSGMGTYNIINILSKKKKLVPKIITISNNHNDLLRKYLVKRGYKILYEEIIYEKHKYYNLIVFIKGKEKYNYKDYILGVNIVNKELYINYLNYLINKYNNITKNNLINKKKKIFIEKMLDYQK